MKWNKKNKQFFMSSRDEDDDDSAEPRDVPMQRLPIPFGAIPQQYPLTHMPQQQIPAQHMMPPQQQQQPQMQQLPPQIPFVVSHNMSDHQQTMINVNYFPRIFFRFVKSLLFNNNNKLNNKLNNKPNSNNNNNR